MVPCLVVDTLRPEESRFWQYTWTVYVGELTKLVTRATELTDISHASILSMFHVDSNCLPGEFWNSDKPFH